MINNTRGTMMSDGSAAYDLRVGDLAEEKRTPKRHSKRRAQRAVLTPFGAVSVAAVVFMIVLMLFSYERLYERKMEVAKLQSEIEELTETQTLLRGQYDGKLNFSEIEKNAVQLGMAKPTGCETVYINLNGEDRGEVLGSNALSLTSLSRLAGEAFTHLAEYLAQPET